MDRFQKSSGTVWYSKKAVRILDAPHSGFPLQHGSLVPQDFGMRKLALETSSTGRSSIPRGDLRATFWRERG